MAFVKVGSTFFNQKADGSLLPVVDSETNKLLKSGQLGYTAKSSTEPLNFSSGASLGIQSGGSTIGSANLNQDQVNRVAGNNPELARSLGLNLVPNTPTPTSTYGKTSTPASPTPAGGDDDINTMLKNALKSVLQPAAGAENLADLESRRQALLRQQLLSSPYSTEGERVLTASQKLDLMRTRGQQFEPELQALESEITKIRDASDPMEKLQALSLVLDIQEKLQPTKTDSKEMFDQATTLRKEFVTASGDYIKIRDSYNRILASSNNVSAAGDLSLIYNYMKMLDPGSTVRESEFAMAESAASIPDRIKGAWLKVISGERLDPDVRDDYINKANEIYEASKSQNDSLVSQYIRLADEFGLDPDNVVLDLDIYDSINAPQSQSNDSNRIWSDEYGAWYIINEDGTGTVDKSGKSVNSADTATKVANAIKMAESGGKQVSGKSGEYGMYQFLPSTWNKLSAEYNKIMTGDNEPLEMTPENENVVSVWKIDQLLKRGLTPHQVALVWNTSLGGVEQPLEKKGVNSSGVAYDSVAYANKVMSYLT